MTVRSGWLLNASEATPGQSRADTRLAPTGTMVPAGALSTRPGLIPGNNPCNLTGSGMSGTLGVGRAVVAGTSSQGAYPVAVTVAEPITVPNGDPSNPRIDSVFLIVYDKLFDTSGNTLAQVQYVTGTPAGSPTAPSAPATTNSALRLWDILVPAGASAGSPINWGTALTDRRSYTSSVGGINPDGSTAGWYSGQYRDGGSTTGLERYNGSAWESRLYLGTSGRVVIGADAELYRDSANVLRTPDGLTVDGNFSAGNVNTGVWIPYTPQWLGGTTNPVLNNGVITGRYCRVGKMCTVMINLKIGSTSTMGSGLYTFTLPFAAVNRSTDVWIGSTNASDNGTNYPGICQLNGGASAVACINPSGSGGSNPGGWTSTSPFTWGNADVAQISITYETA